MSCADVSVIIPAYNASASLRDAVTSCLEKSSYAVEIVVVDDGSVDDTRLVAAELVEEFGIKYYFQENSGPGAARNTGIEKSSGRYVCFLDADDLLINDGIQKRLDALRQLNADFVFGDYILKPLHESLSGPVLGDGRFLDYFADAIVSSDDGVYTFNDGFIEKYFHFEPHPIITNTVTIERKLLERVGGFRTDCLVAEDIDLWVRLIDASIPAYINEPVSIYCRNATSITNSDYTRYHKSTIMFYSRVGLSGRFSDDARHKLMLKNKFDLLYEHSKRGKFTEFFRDLAFYKPTMVSTELLVMSAKSVVKMLLSSVRRG